MPVEPGIVDANVLVYALDADAPQHGAARALLETARDDASTTLFVTSQILCEFYSIVTNARRVPKPRSPADALNAISGLLFSMCYPFQSTRLTGGSTCFVAIL